MNNNFKSGFKRFAGSSEFTALAINLVLFLFFTFATDTFFTAYNISNLMKQTAITGIIAFAATIIISSGHFDLSMESQCGMSCLICSLLMTKMEWKPPIIVILLVNIVLCVFLGACNAALVYEFALPPFIATMGTNSVIRAAIKIICQGKTITGIYPNLIDFAEGKYFGFIPKLSVVWIGLALVIAFAMKYTPFGRNIYTIGCSKEVAKLSGIKVREMVYASYMLVGVLTGIAGVLLAGRIQCAIPTGGTGYSMNAISAAVIGGTSMAGGKGSVIGTMMGSLLIVMISNGGIQLGIDSFTMDISTGLLIIIAVLLDTMKSKKKVGV